MESLRKQAANLLHEQKKYRRWLAVFLCLAVLVTSGTVAALMMKGQAMNRKQKVLECHLSVHEHTAECYETDAESGEKMLVCGYADYVVHTHMEECMDEEGNVVCQLPEVEAHTHEEGCFEDKRVLVCELEETQGHIHTEECRKLICGKEESQGHIHTESCRKLVCAQEENPGHVHTDACRTLTQGALKCASTEEGHEHNQDCYEQTESITCGLEEGAGSHVHTESCYDLHGCGLVEGIDAHTHTEKCYNPYGCGLKEGQGAHAHSLACYEVRKVAVCGKLELHTHVKEGDNSCYDENGSLICGIPELREHVHGEDCFRIVEEAQGEADQDGTHKGETGKDETDKADVLTGETNDGAAASQGADGADKGAGEADQTADGADKDAGEADQTAGGADKDAAEADQTDGGTDKPADRADEESGSDTAESAADGDKDGAGMEGEIGGTLPGETQEGDNSLASGDGAGTDKKHSLTAGGDDYTVTVTYGDDAEIPESAELKVREIPEGTDEYDKYYQEMVAAVNGEGAETQEEGETDSAEGDSGSVSENEIEVSFVRFFDITFMVNGEKYEPKAPVDIRVSYKDAVELGEDETASVVHFAKEGTEVLEAQVADTEEGSDFAFTQSSFSVSGTGVFRAPARGTLKYSKNGCTITVTYDKKAIRANAKLMVEEIVDDGEEGGNSSYRKYLNNSEGAIKEKKNNKDKDQKAEFARVFKVSVVDAETGKSIDTASVDVTVSLDTPVVASGAGVAAMVQNTEDSAVVLGNQDVAEGQSISTFSGTQTFSAASPNVMAVMMTEEVPLDEGQEGDGGSGSPISSVLGGITIPESGQGNDWQIVKERYEGNQGYQSQDVLAGTSSVNVFVPVYKTTSKDGRVSVQKNVIPTEIENEFLVYLSIDTRASIEEYFSYDIFKALSHKDQSAGSGAVPGTVITNESQLVGVGVGKTGDKNATNIQLIRHETGEYIGAPINVGWGKSIDESGSNANNISLVVKAGGKYYLLGGLNDGDNGISLHIPENVYIELKKDIYHSVVLSHVTDPMGPYIDFRGCDTNRVDGTIVEPSEENSNTLTWKPVVKEAAPQTLPEIDALIDGKKTKVVVAENVAELVYKVRLNVEGEGFNSCAACINTPGTNECERHKNNVNGTTTLKYSYKVKENGSITEVPGEIDFQIPVVRGLLYDMAAKKVDAYENDTPLSGAEFKLQNASGAFIKVSADPNSADKVWTSGEDGSIRFEDLPWGTYTLVETKAPEGYQAVPESGRTIGTFTVCYTTDKDQLTTQQGTDGQLLANMIYRGSVAHTDAEGTTSYLAKDAADSNINMIKNEKILPIKVVKVWEDNGNEMKLRPENVQFKVEYKDKDGNWIPIPADEGVEEGGIVTLNGDDQAGSNTDSWEKLVKNLPDSAEYRVSEIDLDSNYEMAVDSDGSEDGYASVKKESVEIEPGISKKINVYTITNKPKEITIELVKVAEKVSGDTEDIFLGRAQFKLFKKTKEAFGEENPLQSAWGYTNADGETKVPVIQISKEETGFIWSGTLQAGNYWLQEIAAPDEYETPKQPYVLAVEANKVIYSSHYFSNYNWKKVVKLPVNTIL